MNARLRGGIQRQLAVRVALRNDGLDGGALFDGHLGASGAARHRGSDDNLE